MTDDVLTPEERQEIDARMRRFLLLSTKGLSELYKDLNDDQIKADLHLSAMSVSWNLFASGERQEALMNQMHEESERMTRLTRCIKIMTGVVLAVAVFQVILLVIQIFGT